MNRSMDDSDDESLTKQVLNMVLENNAIFPYLVGWFVFNIVILVLIIYISVKISLR